MGSNSSQLHTRQPVFHYVLDYKYCKVWVRKTDRLEHMEEYQIRIRNHEELEKYKAMFALRTQHPVLINTLYFTHESDDYMCGDSHKGSILTERIPYRLCQLNGIPHTETLPILSILLHSYNILHQIYGLFIVQSTMVGINHNNNIKIWHHTDFSSPSPENSNCSSIQIMITSIIKAVEKITFYPANLEYFSETIQRNLCSLNSFAATQDLLRVYLQSYHIKNKNQFSCLDRFLRQPEIRLFFMEDESPPKSKSKNKYSFRMKKCISPMERHLRGGGQSSRESSLCSQNRRHQNSGVKVHGSPDSRKCFKNTFNQSSESSRIVAQNNSAQNYSSINSEYFLVKNSSKTKIRQSDASTASLCNMTILPAQNPYQMQTLTMRNRIGKPSIHTTQSSSFFENPNAKGEIVRVLGRKRK